MLSTMRRRPRATLVLGLLAVGIVLLGSTVVMAYAELASSSPGDLWLPVSTVGVPAGRFQHSAVWTGSEMIIWGGRDQEAAVSGGGRYDPRTDTWRPVQTAGAPARLSENLAVWTGKEMIVWGRTDGWGEQAGGRYNPELDKWSAISWDGAPSPRNLATAVWTGTEMIVWGGRSADATLGDGDRYNPATNTWTALTQEGAPSPRAMHVAVWTGKEMIIWGGGQTDGAAYNPGTDSWRPISTSGAPSVPAGMPTTAVWTGAEMIVRGCTSDDLSMATAGAYYPTTNTWRPVLAGGPFCIPRAVWTGREVIYWEGIPWVPDGRYNPKTDAWVPLPTEGSPAWRDYHTAVWTGKEMIVWGGWEQETGAALANGGRYVPPVVRSLFLPLVWNGE